MIDRDDFLRRVTVKSCEELSDAELDAVVGGLGDDKPKKQPFIEIGDPVSGPPPSPVPYFDNLPYRDSPPPFNQWV